MVDTVALLAEFLGSFLLALSVLASGGNAYVVGAALAVIILLVGKISGAHVNPAVTAAIYAKGGLSVQETGLYMLSQIAGGFASLYTYKIFA